MENFRPINNGMSAESQADLMFYQNSLLKDQVKQLREVVELLDADWTEGFPEGPDTELREGISIADSTLNIWRKARAALSVYAQSEQENDDG